MANLVLVMYRTNTEYHDDNLFEHNEYYYDIESLKNFIESGDGHYSRAEAKRILDITKSLNF